MNTIRFSAPMPALTEGLPPPEFWVGLQPQDFLNDANKIMTPTDDRGLIRIDELIETVKSFIDPAYEWPPGTSVHHIYWAKQNYEAYAAYLEDPTPKLFREASVNKIQLPRVFENVLHRVTLEPVMPEFKVMRGYVEAWSVALRLFHSVSKATEAHQLSQNRLSRSDMLTSEQLDTGQAIMDETFQRHFKGVQQHLGALATIPQELWPFDAGLQTYAAALDINTVAARRHRPCTSLVLGVAA